MYRNRGNKPVETKAVTKTVTFRRFQRVGGWCEPIVRQTQNLSLPSRRDETAVVSPVTTTLVLRDCLILQSGEKQ